MTFKKGKTPGLDGIPIEVYQVFLIDCLHFSYEEGILAGTQRESAISLLLKQEPCEKCKDPVHLRNWRPLTLQGYDSKILAKCIATRINYYH